MAQSTRSRHLVLTSLQMRSLMKSPFPAVVEKRSTKRGGFALRMAVLASSLLVPTLVHAHGGMGPDEIGPPIMTSGLVGFACYWLVMLWPSVKKKDDFGVSGYNLSTFQAERRPKKRSARVKRIPRLRKIEGSAQLDRTQPTRREVSDG